MHRSRRTCGLYVKLVALMLCGLHMQWRCESRRLPSRTPDNSSADEDELDRFMHAAGFSEPAILTARMGGITLEDFQTMTVSELGEFLQRYGDHGVGGEGRGAGECQLKGTSVENCVLPAQKQGRQNGPSPMTMLPDY